MNKNRLAIAFILLGSFVCLPACHGNDAKKDESSKANKYKVRPEPSISSNSPSFQSPLTKLIRSKGHADAAYKKGQFKKAKKIYLRCVQDPTVNHRALGFCYVRLAIIFEKEGDLESAKSYYDKALVQMKKFKNRVQQERIEVKLEQLKSKSSNS